MAATARSILDSAARVREGVGHDLHDRLAGAIYADASAVTEQCVTRDGEDRRLRVDGLVDRILTSRLLGFPAMGLVMAIVFWLTIAGANVPSAMLADLLLGTVYGWLHAGFDAAGAPWWLSGFAIDGVYLATAWVVSVMLPPMAIFFPLFTLAEDLGYLPRVAYNLDRLFKRSGAHGKQALTMMMGYGCNAAGVVSTRIIDSPRERMIAIVTNNFAVCNGRWPTLILMGAVFVGAAAPPAIAGIVAATSVVAVAVLGIVVTLLVSAMLSRTLLRGEASTFSLELPPYRRPRLFKTLYTSVVDRTLVVLRRAVVMAAPAGAAIWLLGNTSVANASLAEHAIRLLDPVGLAIGLNGVILLAYVLAIPANEIVVPTILMLTLNAARSSMAQTGVMIELDDPSQVGAVLTGLGGWTLLTATNLMLFSLLHNPCSTTILTIWQETRSLKWTAIATLLPILLGVLVCLATATIVRLMGLV